MLQAMETGKVHLLPGLFAERAEVNRAYLMELENQGLLQNFYLEAGIIMPGLQVVEDPETALLHWGWEAPTCQLRGHFLGHWMSAAAKLVAATGDVELKAKLIKIVDELEKCQKLNGGQWIGPIPEKYFKKLEREEYIWSPQYVMHKTLLGLMHAYRVRRDRAVTCDLGRDQRLVCGLGKGYGSKKSARGVQRRGRRHVGGMGDALRTDR